MWKRSRLNAALCMLLCFPQNEGTTRMALHRGMRVEHEYKFANTISSSQGRSFCWCKHTMNNLQEEHVTFLRPKTMCTCCNHALKPSWCLFFNSFSFIKMFSPKKTSGLHTRGILAGDHSRRQHSTRRLKLCNEAILFPEKWINLLNNQWRSHSSIWQISSSWNKTTIKRWRTKQLRA